MYRSFFRDRRINGRDVYNDSTLLQHPGDVYHLLLLRVHGAVAMGDL